MIFRSTRETNVEMMAALGLPNFETVADCVARNDEMLARFARRGRATRRTQALAESHADGRSDDVCPWDGNWLASRSYRLLLIPQAVDLLQSRNAPPFFVTVVHPRWETDLNDLRHINIDAAKQWIYRRLRDVVSPLLVVGGFEVSLCVELDGSSFWAGHFHLVIAGAQPDHLKEARHRNRKYMRPLTIEKVNDVAMAVAYSTKRTCKRGIAYLGNNGRQQRRKLPLTVDQQIEFDAWLLSLSAGNRTFFYGCRLHASHLRLIPT